MGRSGLDIYAARCLMVDAACGGGGSIGDSPLLLSLGPVHACTRYSAWTGLGWTGLERVRQARQDRTGHSEQ